MTSGTGRRLKVWLGYAFAGLVVVSVMRHTGVSLRSDMDLFHVASAQQLALALCGFTLHTGLNAVAFASLVDGTGRRLDRSTIVSVWMATILAKYVPGGVWQVLGRGAVLVDLGMSKRLVLGASICEQLISLCVCVAIALVVGLVTLGAPFTAGVSGLGVLGLTFWAVLRIQEVTGTGGPGVCSRCARAIAIYALSMIPFGFSYLVIVLPADPWQFVVALFTGTVAGVLAFPVPGGVGVRESVAVLLDASATSPGGLFAALVVVRGVALIAEAMVSALGTTILWRRGRQSA